MNIAFAGFRHAHILSLYDSAVKNEGVNVVGCFEADAATADSLSHINFNYSTFEELLADERVEAVAIGDYYQKRGAMVIEALRHGKHVICDKPICTELDELKTIRELSTEKGLVVSCMLDLRYMPQVEKVKEMLAEGAIGDLHIASFTGQHPLNYGVRPSWYFEDGKHGGTINDIAIHGIDLLRYLTGRDLTKINCARSWNAFASEVPSFKDSAHLMIEMGEMAVIADVSYAAPRFSGILPTYWDFKLWGSDGMISFNYRDPSIYLYKGDETVIRGEPAVPDCLGDFMSEVSGIRTVLNESDVLASQEQVLKIQKFADSAAD